MKPDFWHDRWAENKIGFHRPDTHPFLTKHFKNFRDSTNAFVPLCGKSLDMVWLAAQELNVIGVELSSKALDDFFKENRISFSKHTDGKFQKYTAENIELFQGNLFDLSKDRFSKVDFWYDRAALVALPPDMRRNYAEFLIDNLPGKTKGLLITFDFSDTETGPPFSVPEKEVRKLFSSHFDIKKVESVKGEYAGRPGMQEAFLLV